jgi:transcription elongation factor GreA
MVEDKTKISKKGYSDIEDELKDRMTSIREKIANDIELAREQGDLSENSAYKSALEQKEFNENRIEELNKTLQNVVIIGKSNSNGIGIGSKITLENLANHNNQDYEIVGGREADPRNNKISIISPLGKGLEGKKSNEIVTISSPIGEIKYKIISIK